MIVRIVGEITEDTVRNVAESYNQTTDDVANVYINSEGGSLPAMFAIKSIIESSGIYTRVYGYDLLASAAFVLFFTLRVDEKVLLPMTVGLHHQTRGDIPTLSITTTTIEKFYRSVMKSSDFLYLKDLYDLVGMSSKHVKQISSGKDALFTPEEMNVLLETSRPKTCGL